MQGGHVARLAIETWDSKAEENATAEAQRISGHGLEQQKHFWFQGDEQKNRVATQVDPHPEDPDPVPPPEECPEEPRIFKAKVQAVKVTLLLDSRDDQ